jgi:hypothetical protein
MKAILLLTLIILTLSIKASEDCRFGTHGMVIVPDEKDKASMYLSHIPMFMYPHDYQFLFKASFNSSSKQLEENKLYTFLPEKMCLDYLIHGITQDFIGDIYLGSFEDQGLLISEKVKIKIDNILYVNNLKKETHSDNNPSYFVFGKNENKINLLKIIQNEEKSFDHLVKVEIANEGKINEGEIIKLHDILNEETSRIKSGITYKGFYLGKEVDISVNYEYSCLVGPDFDKKCDNEKTLKFLYSS